MATKVPTNSTKGSIASVPYKRKTRLLLWGGAAIPGDNSAFEFAKANVVRDYKNADKGNFVFVEKRIRVAKDIITSINGQDDDSIRSLDIWTHGGPQALYLTTADPPPPKEAPWYTQGMYTAGRWGTHNSSLYRTRSNMIFQAAGWVEGSAVVPSINFAKFAKNAKVELHGCRTADTESDGDNIAADLSLRLYEAGKTNSVVIGHADKANPNIKGGGEALAEQDYRHGQRVIFNNGKVVKVIKQNGFIAEPKADL